MKILEKIVFIIICFLPYTMVIRPEITNKKMLIGAGLTTGALAIVCEYHAYKKASVNNTFVKKNGFKSYLYKKFKHAHTKDGIKKLTPGGLLFLTTEGLLLGAGVHHILSTEKKVTTPAVKGIVLPPVGTQAGAVVSASVKGIGLSSQPNPSSKGIGLSSGQPTQQPGAVIPNVSNLEEDAVGEGSDGDVTSEGGVASGQIPIVNDPKEEELFSAGVLQGALVQELQMAEAQRVQAPVQEEFEPLFADYVDAELDEKEKESVDPVEELFRDRDIAQLLEANIAAEEAPILNIPSDEQLAEDKKMRRALLLRKFFSKFNERDKKLLEENQPVLFAEAQEALALQNVQDLPELKALAGATIRGLEQALNHEDTVAEKTLQERKNKMDEHAALVARHVENQRVRKDLLERNRTILEEGRARIACLKTIHDGLKDIVPELNKVRDVNTVAALLTSLAASVEQYQGLIVTHKDAYQEQIQALQKRVIGLVEEVNRRNYKVENVECQMAKEDIFAFALAANSILTTLGLDPIDLVVEMDTKKDEEFAYRLQTETNRQERRDGDVATQELIRQMRARGEIA